MQMSPFDKNYPIDLDEKLIGLVKVGSQDALGLLLSIHEKMIYNVFAKVTGDQKLSQELLKKVLVKTILNMHCPSGPLDFRSLMISRAIKELINNVGFLKTSVRLRSTEENGSSLGASNEFDANILNIGHTDLLTALFGLGTAERIVFVLIGIFNLPVSLIARSIGINQQDTFTLYQKAMRLLVARLSSNEAGGQSKGMNLKDGVTDFKKYQFLLSSSKIKISEYLGKTAADKARQTLLKEFQDQPFLPTLNSIDVVNCLSFDQRYVESVFNLGKIFSN